MVNLITLSESFTELGYTAYFFCDSCLTIVNHKILISCNTFLQATTASSCDITAIKNVIKMFLPASKWSIDNSNDSYAFAVYL